MQFDYDKNPKPLEASPVIEPGQVSINKESGGKILEAVTQRCSVKKVFLEISQNSQ